MQNHIITGIGCFAGPEKLSRIFLKMVRNYTLGSLEEFERGNGHIADETAGINLLKALIAGKATRQDSSRPDSSTELEHRKITGFFMFQNGRRLKLSIFARGRGSRREIHSAVLEEFTRIRHKRLN